MTKELSPGEAKTRARQRRHILYCAVGGLVGGVIGFSTGFFDQGDGNLFAGDWDQLSLPPAVSIGVAIGLAVGLILLPLYGFRFIDEHQREQNLIGLAGGSIAALSSFPIWAALYAGGFTPAPHAFGIFAISFVSMGLSFAYARFAR